MISRYTLPEMECVWSDEERFETWRRVEVLAAEAQVKIGRIPSEALPAIRHAPAPVLSRVRALEDERDHEVLAFLSAYCEPMPASAARWVHLGMTSYDLVDTGLGYTASRACDVMLQETGRLRGVLARRATEHWETRCVGRTHGMHAEPTTFGHKLAVLAFAVDRCFQRIQRAKKGIAVGTISGAVGTYSLIDPAVEEHVCAALGLGVEPVPTQVVARDRHAELLQALATLGACVEQLATEIRLLSRSEVREVEEPRTRAYQGSSAMPHKRNPTGSERLVGLARVLRGYAGVVLEDVALWHERDLTNSAVERIVLPDAFCIAHYQVVAATDLVSGLNVFPEQMARALDQDEFICSSAALTALLDLGVDREHAYRRVQYAADRAQSGGSSFLAALTALGVPMEALSPAQQLGRRDVLLRRLEALGED